MLKPALILYGAAACAFMVCAVLRRVRPAGEPMPDVLPEERWHGWLHTVIEGVGVALVIAATLYLYLQGAAG